MENLSFFPILDHQIFLTVLPKNFMLVYVHVEIIFLLFSNANGIELPASCFLHSAIILVNKLKPIDLPHWFYYTCIISIVRMCHNLIFRTSNLFENGDVISCTRESVFNEIYTKLCLTATIMLTLIDFQQILVE